MDDYCQSLKKLEIPTSRGQTIFPEMTTDIILVKTLNFSSDIKWRDFQSETEWAEVHECWTGRRHDIPDISLWLSHTGFQSSSFAARPSIVLKERNEVQGYKTNSLKRLQRFLDYLYYHLLTIFRSSGVYPREGEGQRQNFMLHITYTFHITD